MIKPTDQFLPGEVIVFGDGVAVTRVLQVQKRQTLAYWVSRSHTKSQLQSRVRDLRWKHHAWPPENHGFKDYVCGSSDDAMLCAMDELDTYANEFGPVCP